MRHRILAALGPLLGVALLLLAVVVIRHELQTYHLHDVLGNLREIPLWGLALALVLARIASLVSGGVSGAVSR